MASAFNDMPSNSSGYRCAVIAAMRAAFDDLLGRFEPETLRQKFDRGLRPGALLGISNEAKYWDLFTEIYDDVARDASEGLSF